MQPSETAALLAGWDSGLALEDDLEGLDGLLRDHLLREAADYFSAIAGRPDRPEGPPGDPARIRLLLRLTERVLERSESMRQALLLELAQTRAQERFCDVEAQGPRGAWLSEQA
jgi:hypothetical protein